MAYNDYHDCGDSWMWGMNYLNRAIARPDYNLVDQRVANLLGTNFSLHCPDRLPDTAHTFARPSGGDAWPTPTPKANFVWADGSFMGMVLPARLAVLQVAIDDRDLCSSPWHGELEEVRHCRRVKTGSGVVRVHGSLAHPLARRQG